MEYDGAVDKLESVLKQLQFLHSGAGALYIVHNPSWKDEQCLKIGKTKAQTLKRRLYNYNAGAPENAICKHVLVCKHVDLLEDHVKMAIGPFLVNEQRVEWVRM